MPKRLIAATMCDVDKQANAAYIRVGYRRPVAKTVELAHNILVDYDEDGSIVGFELLDACWQLKNVDWEEV